MCRKLLLDPYLAIHGKIMAKNGIWSYFRHFYRFCPYLCRVKWGSTNSPHIRDMMMSLFSLWGRPFMTGDGLKMVHFGPKRAKHGRLVNTPKWSKRVRKGPKWSTWVFLTIRNLFGPIWILFDCFKQELIFCSEAPLPTPALSIWGKKIISADKRRWPNTILSLPPFPFKTLCSG